MSESAPPITIILADDHPIIRSGLRTLLETQPDFLVIGEVGDGLEALRLVEKMKPRIAVADVTMPGLNGLDMTRRLRQLSPDTRVIVLSMHTSEAFVGEALGNGAAAYIVKDSTLTELVQAVRDVAGGKRFLSPAISRQVIDTYIEKGDMPTAHKTLTHREREVFQLVAEGNTNAEIGKRLFISPRTVEVHRANMMKKLGLKSPMELFAYAVKRGVISF